MITATCVIIYVNSDDKKEALDIWIGRNESGEFWFYILNGLVVTSPFSMLFNKNIKVLIFYNGTYRIDTLKKVFMLQVLFLYNNTWQ